MSQSFNESAWLSKYHAFYMGRKLTLDAPEELPYIILFVLPI